MFCDASLASSPRRQSQPDTLLLAPWIRPSRRDLARRMLQGGCWRWNGPGRDAGSAGNASSLRTETLDAVVMVFNISFQCPPVTASEAAGGEFLSVNPAPSSSAATENKGLARCREGFASWTWWLFDGWAVGLSTGATASVRGV